jgi:hypothetical protein
VASATSKAQSQQALAKLHQKALEQKISWKRAISEYNKKSDPQSKTPDSIALKNLRTLLERVKLALTPEETELVINAFEEERVSGEQIEERGRKAVEQLDSGSHEKQAALHSLAEQIAQRVQKERIDLQHLLSAQIDRT